MLGGAATLLACVSVGAAVPAAANAFSSAVSYSEDGSFPWPNKNLAFDSRTATITNEGDDRGLDLYFEDPATGVDRTFEFAPPAGERLRAGTTYVGAQRYPFQDPGRPGLDVSGDGYGCNKLRGAFRVEDIATTSAGKVTRLHVIFEHHCDTRPSATFGEIRYGYPEPEGPTPMPTVLRWPPQERNTPAVARPVTVRGGSGAGQLQGATIAGDGADAFAITDNGCANQTIGPGQSCQVWVAYDPRTSGAKRAQLQIARAAGGRVRVDLVGNAHGGTTALDIDQSPESDLGEGRDLAYTPANGRFFAEAPRAYGTEANPRYVHGLGLTSPDGTVLSAFFYLPDHEQLQVGRTYQVTPDRPAYDGGAFIEILVYGGACNASSGWFRFDEYRLDAFGEPAAVDVSFVDNCQRTRQFTMTGRIRRRAGNSTPPHAWTAGAITDPVLPEAPSQPGDGGGQAGLPANIPAPADETPASKPVKPATTRTDLALDLTDSERRTCRRYLGRLPKVTPGVNGRDRIRGTRKRDAIAAGDGDDRVAAGDGGDCVAGGPGKDRIDGGDGRDVLMGGPGNDTLIGGPGKDVLLCGPGRDTVYAGPGDRWGDCERVVRVRR